MSLDANIILAGKAPQFDDPLTVQNRQATLSALMGRQQMQQMELEGAQQARQGQQTLNDLYRTNVNPDGSVNRQGLTSGLAAVGQGSQIHGVIKQFGEQDKALADLAELKSKIGERDFKVLADANKAMNARIASLARRPGVTEQDVMGQLGAAVASGTFDIPAKIAGMDRNQYALGLVQDMPKGQPDRLLDWLIERGLQSSKDGQLMELLLPKTETRNMGGSDQAFSTNQFTGQVTPGQTFAKTVDPNTAANNARMAAEGAANRGNAMQIAKLGDERALDRLAWEQTGGAGTGSDPTQVVLTKQFGKAELGRRWKADGSLEPIPGGSADQKTEMRRVGGEAVDSVIAELRDKYNLLDSAGGITNPDNSTLANLPAALSSSGLGQATGRMLGTQNQSARNSIAQARPILLQAIMKATGMSAKQMDSNAELKLYLSTATDPTLDVMANREALDRLEKLFGSGAPAAPGTVLRFDAMGRPIP